jgi:hypothetical protein
MLVTIRQLTDVNLVFFILKAQDAAYNPARRLDGAAYPWVGE